MKSFFLTSLFFVALSVSAQEKKEPSKTQIVEASCGQCHFGLKGKGCDLAVKIGDTAYYVEGTSIDDHGDAHASDGFCETVRKAAVEGRVKNNRFVATSFTLLPEEKIKN